MAKKLTETIKKFRKLIKILLLYIASESFFGSILILIMRNSYCKLIFFIIYVTSDMYCPYRTNKDIIIIILN